MGHNNIEKKFLIDIDPEDQYFTIAFKDFFFNHFIDSVGLCMHDVDTYFYESMTGPEKEIAMRLIRNNLKFRNLAFFQAAGELRDEEALPILYEMLNRNTDLSWKLSIGRAIWKINSDDVYPHLLLQLRNHPSETLKAAHFREITDIKNKESIKTLFHFLNDESDYIQDLALSALNSIFMHERFAKIIYDKKFFLDNAEDKTFIKKLTQNLQTLVSPFFG